MAAVAAVVFALCQREGPYDFLRPLHPTEHLEQMEAIERGVSAPNPIGFVRVFDFAVPVRDVDRLLASHWRRESRGEETTESSYTQEGFRRYYVAPPARTVLLVTGPGGPKGSTCTLSIWNAEPPTWLEQKMRGVKDFLRSMLGTR